MRATTILLALASLAIAAPLEIRFSKPAESWEQEALPIGNGRLGAMIFGDPARDRIQFNVDSLWTGGDNPSGGYDQLEFGAYQNLGDLVIESSPSGATRDAYSRILDLATGIHTVTWRQDGTTFTREAFASHPNQTIAIRVSASQPGKLSGTLKLAGAHDETTRPHLAGLSFSGKLSNGLQYAARLATAVKGGSLKSGTDSIRYTDCDEVLILLAAATDYAMGETDGTPPWRSGDDPAKTVIDQLETALPLGWKKLRADHLTDHQSLMGRVALDLGPAPDLDTPARIQAVKDGATDPALEALQFHYGRYLLIGSSRPGSLPANLQGLWNHSNQPPWHSDYHTNINLQMNYWLAEPANLADCHTPLFDWVTACIPAATRATRKAFGDDTPGWTMRTSVNAFGGNGWKWNLPASAWLALHFWEHYAFSGDTRFLRETAWPVFQEVSEFWLDHLIEKDGKLLIPDGWSPEHGPREDGVAHDQQIVWDLFTHTLAAADALGAPIADPAFVARIRSARDRLLGPEIGSWGQLMEWTTERPDLAKSGHRHTSHLFAVFPGAQISTAKTPALANAAATSLEARGNSGDSRRSWTWPWRTALWARLGEPEKAHEMVRNLLVHNTMPNLYTTHPPFQIDGNLGITAGVCEMLLQSHAGEIAILPALPKAWPSGSFTGLRARGGITIDATWQDGLLTSATLHPDRNIPILLRLPGKPARKLKLKAGTPLTLP